MNEADLYTRNRRTHTDARVRSFRNDSGYTDAGVSKNNKSLFEFPETLAGAGNG